MKDGEPFGFNFKEILAYPWVITFPEYITILRTRKHAFTFSRQNITGPKDDYVILNIFKFRSYDLSEKPVACADAEGFQE
jgi:hypothetical protein